jgi:phosphate starvation-inducible protein PhoH
MKRNKYPPNTVKANGENISIRHKITPKNTAQALYIDSLREQPLTICNGPAGSGKTYIVTAIAVEKLINQEVDRIIITRPVVEAGEHLGFLPGTLEEKLDPYLLPLLDSIEDHVGPTMTKKLLENRKIEIAPLAFMRGRSFNNCLPADHKVLLSSGEWIRMDTLLEEFSSGKSLEVVTYNIESKKLENKKIQFAFKQPNQHKKLVKLTLKNGTEILATPDHKLFTQRGYIPMVNLTLEDGIISLSEAQNDEPPLARNSKGSECIRLEISKIEIINSDDDVYDITVEDNHNFFTNGGVLSSNCYVILDECQNATVEQVKMFVTRIGFNSFFAINGDVSQSDLRKPKGAGDDWENGLQYIVRKLKGRDEKINYIEFFNRDVVRSQLVQRILNLLDAPDTY